MSDSQADEQFRAISSDLQAVFDRLDSLEHKVDVGNVLKENVQDHRSAQADLKLSELQRSLRDDIGAAALERTKTEEQLRTTLEELLQRTTHVENETTALDKDEKRIAGQVDEHRARLLQLEQRLINSTSENRTFIEQQVQRMRAESEALKKQVEDSLREALLRRLSTEQEHKSKFEESDRQHQTNEQKRLVMEQQFHQKIVDVEAGRHQVLEEVSAVRERAVRDANQVVDQHKKAVQKQLADEKSARDAALQTTTSNMEKLGARLRAETDAQLADVVKALEAEKTARLAAEAELRRLVTKSEQTKAKELEEMKKRLDRAEAKLRDDSSSLKQQLTTTIEKLRGERLQVERKLQQQFEESLSRAREELRAEAADVAQRLHTEIQVRTEQDQELGAAIRQEEDSRIGADHELREFVELQVAAIKDQTLQTRQQLEQSVQENANKRALIEAEFRQKVSDVEAQLNSSNQTHGKAEAELGSRLDLEIQNRNQFEVDVRAHVDQAGASLSQKLDSSLAELGKSIELKSGQNRTYIEELNGKTVQAVDTIRAKEEADVQNLSVRLEGQERLRQGLEKDVILLLEKEKNARAEAVQQEHQFTVQQVTSNRNEITQLSDSLSATLTAETGNREANMKQLRSELQVAQATLRDDVKQMNDSLAAKITANRAQSASELDAVQKRLDAVNTTLTSAVQELAVDSVERVDRERDERVSAVAAVVDAVREETQLRLAAVDEVTQEIVKLFAQSEEETKARTAADGAILDKLSAESQVRAKEVQAVRARVDEVDQAHVNRSQQLKSSFDALLKKEERTRDQVVAAVKNEALEAVRSAALDLQTKQGDIVKSVAAETQSRTQQVESMGAAVAQVQQLVQTVRDTAADERSKIERALRDRIAEVVTQAQQLVQKEEQERQLGDQELAKKIVEVGSQVKHEESTRSEELEAVRSLIERNRDSSTAALDEYNTALQESVRRLERDLRTHVADVRSSIAAQTRESQRQLETALKHETETRLKEDTGLIARIESVASQAAAWNEDQSRVQQATVERLQHEEVARSEAVQQCNELSRSLNGTIKEELDKVRAALTERIQGESATRTALLQQEQQRVDEQLQTVHSAAQDRCAAIERSQQVLEVSLRTDDDANKKELVQLIESVRVEAQTRTAQTMQTQSQALTSSVTALQADLQKAVATLTNSISTERSDRETVLVQWEKRLEDEIQNRVHGDEEAAVYTERQTEYLHAEATKALEAFDKQLVLVQEKVDQNQNQAAQWVQDLRVTQQQSEEVRGSTQQALKQELLEAEQRRGKWEDGVRSYLERELNTFKEQSTQHLASMRERLTQESNSRLQALTQSKDNVENRLAKLRSDMEKMVRDVSAQLNEEDKQLQQLLQDTQEALGREETQRKEAVNAALAKLSVSESGVKELLKSGLVDVDTKITSETAQRKQGDKDMLQRIEEVAQSLRGEREDVSRDIIARITNEAKTRESNDARLLQTLETTLEKRMSYEEETRTLLEQVASTAHAEVEQVRDAVTQFQSTEAQQRSAADTQVRSEVEALVKQIQQQEQSQLEFQELVQKQRQQETQDRTAWQLATVEQTQRSVTGFKDTLRDEVTKLGALLSTETAAREHADESLRKQAQEQVQMVRSELASELSELGNQVKQETSSRKAEVSKAIDLSNQNRVDLTNQIADTRTSIQTERAQLDTLIASIRDTLQHAVETEQAERVKEAQQQKEATQTTLDALSAQSKQQFDKLSLAMQSEINSIDQAIAAVREDVETEKSVRTQNDQELLAQLSAELQNQRDDIMHNSDQIAAQVKELEQRRLALEKTLRDLDGQFQARVVQEKEERIQGDKDLGVKLANNKQERLAAEDELRQGIKQNTADLRQYMNSLTDEVKSHVVAVTKDQVSGEARGRAQNESLSSSLSREIQDRTERETETLKQLNDTRRELAQMKLRVGELQSRLGDLNDEKRAWEDRVRLQLSEHSSLLNRLQEDTKVSSAVMDAKLLDVKHEVRQVGSRVPNGDSAASSPLQSRNISFVGSTGNSRSDPMSTSDLLISQSNAEPVRSGSTARLPSATATTSSSNNTGRAAPSTTTAAPVQVPDSQELAAKYEEWYKPEAPEDPVDVAVSAVLKSLRFPMRIHLPRLGPGLYMADRKISVCLVKGNVLVRKGGGYEALYTYLYDLFAPEVGLEQTHPKRQLQRPATATGSATTASTRR